MSIVKNQVTLANTIILSFSLLWSSSCRVGALTQTVTLRAKRQTLRALCEDLSRVTGDRYEADSQIADLHVTISIHSKPASQLRDCIASVLNLDWEQPKSKDDTAKVYRLFRSRDNSAYEESIKNAEERVFRQQMKKLLAAYKKGKGELERLAQNDPQVEQTIAQPESSIVFSLVAGLPTVTIDEIFEGKRIDLLNSNASIRPEFDKYVAAVSADKGIKNSDKNFKLTAGAIARSFQRENSSIYIGFDCALTDGQSGSVSALSISPPSDFRRWWDSDEKRESRSKIVKGVDFAEHKEAKSLDRLLLEICDSINTDMICESYGNLPATRPFVTPSGKRSLSEAIRLIFGAPMWWSKNGVLLFQADAWWERREIEIPDLLFEEVKTFIKSKPASFSDWSKLTILTEKQWTQLSGLREMGIEFLSYPELKLFKLLSKSERKLAFSTELSSSSLMRSKKAAVMDWALHRLNLDRELIKELPDKWTLTIRDEGDSVVFHGEFLARDGSEPIIVEHRAPFPLLSPENKPVPHRQ